MTFQNWHEPVRLLRTQTALAAKHQRTLAEKVGLHLEADLPFGIATVRLEVHLYRAVRGMEHPRGSLLPTERQLSFLKSLAPQQNPTGINNREEASAWIAHHLMLQTATSLELLLLSRGDQVEKRPKWIDHSTDEVHQSNDHYTVSSIGANGLVYFKGGNGKCAWLTSLTLSKRGTMSLKVSPI